MNRIERCTAQCTDGRLASNLTAACRAAITGGSLLRALYDRPHTVTMKGATDLVTEADVAAEAAIIASLEEDAPGIPVLAEESAGTARRTDEGVLWIVDPLDGTTNYAHSIPIFAVSIALLEQGQPSVAAVFLPMLDELFCAAAGCGTWLNGNPVTVTDTGFLLEALIATGFPYDVHPFLPEITGQLRTLLPKVRDIRRMGAAAVDLAYVACGRLDGCYEKELQPWDTAAGWLLVNAAGGRVSDLADGPYQVTKKEIAATNGVIHGNLLKLLQQK